MKPRKVTLQLEVTTDVSLGLLRKTRCATLLISRDQPFSQIGTVDVHQATASVVQPIPTTTTKKGGRPK